MRRKKPLKLYRLIDWFGLVFNSDTRRSVGGMLPLPLHAAGVLGEIGNGSVPCGLNGAWFGLVLSRVPGNQNQHLKPRPFQAPVLSMNGPRPLT